MADFLWAYWGNIQTLIVTLLLFCGFAILISYLSGDLNKKLFFCSLLLVPIAVIPSIDDLWKARIALIKYELASPENIQAGVQTIQRIGNELENKYLSDDTGCFHL